jgi:serine protease Do
MRIMAAILKAFGIAVVVVVGAALLVAAVVPAVRAQVRHEPLVSIQTMMQGGSEIGVRIRDVTSDDATREKLSTIAGALVTEVQTGGPASTAGLAVGDVVLSFDGEKVRSSRHLSRLIEETPEGREVAIEVMRAGTPRTLRVTPRAAQSFADLGALNRLHERFPADRFQFGNLDSYTYSLSPFMYGRPGRLGLLGLQVQDLTGQLGEYFGATEGALITGVTDSTAAKTAGLKAGDVITAINGQPVRSSADVTRRLVGNDGKVSLTIVRDRKPMTVELTIGRDSLTERRGIAK